MNIPALSPPANRMHLMREPITIATEVLRTRDPQSHYHNFTQIFFSVAGDMYHTVNNQMYFQAPGSCSCVKPYESHSNDTIDSDANPIYICISFFDEFLTSHGYKYFSYANKYAFFEGMAIPSCVTFTGSNREKATELMRGLQDEFNKHKEMSFDIIADMLAEFLFLFCSCATGGAKKNPVRSGVIERANAINKSVTYLAEHYNEKINIDDLAAIATMSRNSFFRNFEMITGTTVSDMLLRFRLKNALPPLVYTEMSLDAIAKNVGLYDKSRFCHAFSKIYGMTPSEYRHKNTANATKKLNYHKRRWRWIEDPDYDEQENTQ